VKRSVQCARFRPAVPNCCCPSEHIAQASPTQHWQYGQCWWVPRGVQQSVPSHASIELTYPLPLRTVGCTARWHLDSPHSRGRPRGVHCHAHVVLSMWFVFTFLLHCGRPSSARLRTARSCAWSRCRVSPRGVGSPPAVSSAACGARRSNPLLKRSSNEDELDQRGGGRGHGRVVGCHLGESDRHPGDRRAWCPKV
jgi:hypothetical protein